MVAATQMFQKPQFLFKFKKKINKREKAIG